MTRTDIHRVGAIDPAAYDHVLEYSLATSSDGWPVPAIGVNCELDGRYTDAEGHTVNGAHSADGRCCVIGLRGTVKFSEHGTTGKCTVCGAIFTYGSVWVHRATGEHIHIGHTCADKYNFLANSGLIEAYRKRNGELRRAAASAAHRAACAQEREDFLIATPGLADALKVDHSIIADIASKFQSFRSLSPAQVKLVFKIAAEVSNPAIAERHCDAPTGKHTFRGVIVSAKSYDNAYGIATWKMTVKITDADGATWLAWGTMPAVILDAIQFDIRTNARGCEVEVTATLTRGTDAHFAKMTRPRGSIVKMSDVAQAALDHNREVMGR